MHYTLQDPDSFARFVYAGTSTGLSVTMGGTSTQVGLDVVGTSLDRFAYSRLYRGALIGVKATFTLASSGIVSVQVGAQDAAASSGPWADLPGTTSTGRRATSVGTAASSDTAPPGGYFQGGVSLVGARRYIRAVAQVVSLAGATSSGQTVVLDDPNIVLFGPDQYPPDRFASFLSSQAGT